MTEIKCHTSRPPLGAVLVADLLKESSNDITIEWGSESIIKIAGNASKNYTNSFELIRILLQRYPNVLNTDKCVLSKTLIDHWLTFAQTLKSELANAVAYLDKILGPFMYLAGSTLTVADVAVFSELYSLPQLENLLQTTQAKNVQRWMKLIKSQPTIAKTIDNLPLAVKSAISSNKMRSPPVAEVSPGGRLQEGKFVELPFAEMGKVVVRFPPEASGYLHIGHAKAALLNQYYQEAFNGKLIMRFDDTNPAKENVEFEKVILEDVKLLELKPDMFTHTSQYFDLMLKLCEKLIKEGKAFVDDTPAEQMKTEREQKQDSSNRNSSVEKNLSLWAEMKKASDVGIKCCVRAKIDMQSANGCMRDPTIYRCKPEPHPRTGTQYKVYPTYDFACPIVDAIEGVTHVLRTMEYHDRDPQFYWFIEALGLRRPYIWEYSRLSMTNTVLSKRKLTWFVEQGLVDGWDDPRMPTVRGVLRRGMTVEGLRQFIRAQGSSRSVVFMEWDKIWAINKKVIDPIAPRYTALDLKPDPVPVYLKGVTSSSVISVPLHPKNKDVGTKSVWLSPKVLVDQVDAQTFKEGENVTFINYGNVTINKITKGTDGKVTRVDGTPDLGNNDYKKTLKVTWLADTDEAKFTNTYCVFFEHIISKPLLGKDEDFKQFIGHETRTEVPMLGDPELSKLKVGDVIQLQRRGFFRVDVAAVPASATTGRDQPCILFHIPDGHTKEQPGQTKPATKDKVATPAAKEKSPAKASSTTSNADALNQEIVKQGDIIRTLKAAKAEKAKIQAEVATLLALKEKYKSATGTDWSLNAVAPPSKPAAPAASAASGNGTTDVTIVLNNITLQGDKIRKLKAEKAVGALVKAEVAHLLALKSEYKSLTGSEWSPNTKPPAATATPTIAAAAAGDSPENLNTEIREQGDKVRALKESKAAKAELQKEVAHLLALKSEYKSLTGTEWNPNTKPLAATATPTIAVVAAGDSPENLNTKIREQGDKVRALKESKAAKAELQKEVQTLLSLKASFKSLTGMDWTPTTEVKASATAASTAASGSPDTSAKIAEQGDKIRLLKEQKSDKKTLEPEIQKLLALKKQYKEETGQEWKPQSAAPAVPKTPTAGPCTNLQQQIEERKQLLIKLKESVESEQKALEKLEAEYKKSAGDNLQQTKAASHSNGVDAASSGKDQLNEQISQQGNKVRDLKAKKADKSDIDKEVKILLDLKAKFAAVTGAAHAPTTAAVKKEATPKKEQADSDKKAKKDKKPTVKESSPEDSQVSGGLKKQTRLGLEARKESDLSEWYSQVITKGEMIEYYEVSGCYILRPWSYGIWEVIRDFIDQDIKKAGVKNCYFPMFVSKAVLQREKAHLEDFAPEVAWVTHSGSSELAEHIAIRPTSETGMYPTYAKWVQSHRDLPLKLNQWNNVVRWEFKQPQPFIRTREFLWQEGHTAHANKEDADEEVLQMLDLYARVYTDLLALPVVKGHKTEKERFAGSDYTSTVEAYVPASGRGIQGATSHHLGQNFSKMFDIIYDDPETQEKKYVYQNSWGLTTRVIGVMILVHGDNRGLVLPPRVATVQVVVVPCGITASSTAEDRKKLLDSCIELEQTLTAAGVRAEGDYRDNYSPGWKFNHWELKGVPLRLELGPKDMAKGEAVVVRRYNGEKITIKRAAMVKDVKDLLEKTHNEMLQRATVERDARTTSTTDWKEFCSKLDEKHVILAPFCGQISCEETIKKESVKAEDESGGATMGAKSLCIPFEQPRQLTGTDKCIHPSCQAKPQFITLFGRSY